MVQCYFYSLFRMLTLLLWIPRAIFDHGWRAAPKRMLIFLVAIPLFWGLQMVHWLGMLMDTIFFSAWRRIKVESPVFIIGIPRSGTTSLHRTLANDPRFSSAPLWELLFAPSVSEKFFWSTIGRCLHPLRKMFSGHSFFSRMNQVHNLGLNEPEEDFLFLLPLNACFILIALFPSAQGLWRLSRFDQEVPQWERSMIMCYYRACVQKHLFFRKRLQPNLTFIYLSKNPSFTPMIESLRSTFSEPNFVVCAREPNQTVASQISSLRPAFELLGNGRYPKDFSERCVSMLHHYYSYIYTRLLAEKRAPLVYMMEIKHALLSVIEQLYARWDMKLDEGFSQFLHVQSRESSDYRSGHSYTLEDFGLNNDVVDTRFDDVWPIHKDAHAEPASERTPGNI